MKIVLLRHGHAVSSASPGVSDGLRYLSAEGRAEALAAGRRLAAATLVPGAVWCSPLVRAVQTAELAARGWGFEGVVEIREFLAGGHLQWSLEGMRSYEGDASVLMVGHEPQISSLAATLSGDTVEGATTGTLYVLEGEPVPGGCRLVVRYAGGPL